MEQTISLAPWGCEEGTPFSHHINNGRIQKLVVVHAGGIKSLTIKKPQETPISKKNHQQVTVIEPQTEEENIIKTSDFSQGIGDYWKRNSHECTIELISGPTVIVGDHKNYVMVSKRRETWNGIYQDITGAVCLDCLYEIVAYVTVKGGNGEKFQMNTTVELENINSSNTWIHAGSVLVKHMKWKKLQCCFQLGEIHKKVSFVIANPAPNVDLCIGPVSIRPLSKRFVVNLDEDEYFTGITGYCRIIQKDMPEVLSSLTFLTNRAEYGPCGSTEGKNFSFKLSSGEITGFHGTSGSYLHSIGCHVKPSEPSMPAVNRKKVKDTIFFFLDLFILSFQAFFKLRLGELWRL